MNFFSIFKRNLIFKFKKKINIDKDHFDKNISLEDLFSFYKTDKAKYIKSDKTNGHGFSEFYEKHFFNLRDKKLKILEIGSYSGASAAAFSKYFINSEIYCLDVNLTKFLFQSDKIYPFGVDVTNFKMIEKFFNKIDFKNKLEYFDIIIDDGSHLLSHQLKSINYFFKYVRKGGFYVVEDFRFPEYFKHLCDVDEPFLSDLIKKIREKETIFSNIINVNTIDMMIKNYKNIYDYKGYKDISDIMFWEKLN